MLFLQFNRFEKWLKKALGFYLYFDLFLLISKTSKFLKSAKTILRDETMEK